MHAAQNYIYIVFAVLYVIYSIIKAGKKAVKNKPNVSPSPVSEKRDEFKPVQPPVASPLPRQNQGDDMKKMLEELLGKNPEIKIPEKQVANPKHEPVKIKPQPAKIVTHVKNIRATLSHVPSKTKEDAKSFLSGEKQTAKKVFVETSVEEDRDIDFDIRQAIIYSEILKRPQY